MEIAQDYQGLTTYIGTSVQEVLDEGEYDRAEVREWQAEIGQRVVDFYFAHRKNPELEKYSVMLEKVLREESGRLTSKFKKREIDFPVYQDLGSLVETE